MLQNIRLDLGIGCAILKLRHIHIFQRELNPDILRVDLALGKQDNRLHMGASWEQICRLGGFQGEAPLLQQGHVPGQCGGVTGDVDQAFGGHAGDGFNGVGIQALPGRVHGDHIRADALLLQPESSLARVAAEEFRVFDAVAFGVVPGILHRLLHYLHTDDLPGRGGHGQGDGAHAAIQVKHQILLGNGRLVNGSLVEPLGLVVVHLVEGPGRQPEIQAAQGILNKTGTVKGDKFVPQHGVSLLGVHAEHQGSKARDFFQPLHQLRYMGNPFAVTHQAHQDLSGHRTPADVDMAQKPFVGNFVIGGNVVLIYIIHNRILDCIRFPGENQTATVFHHVVGARPEEAGVGPALFAGNGVLGLVPVAVAGGGRQDGNFLQLLPCHPVQAGFHPVRFQPCFFRIIHVPEIAAAAELGHGALPAHPMGGFFQNLRDFSGGPGFPQAFNPYPHPFTDDGVGDKNGDAINVGNALALGGVIRDGGFVDLILFKHVVSSQYQLHTDFLRLEAAFFIEAHGPVVAAPHIQGHRVAVDFPGIVQHSLVDGLGHAAAPDVLVHAQIVDVQRFPVAEHRIVLGFLQNAEGIAHHFAVHHPGDDGPLFVGKQLFQGCFVIFLGPGTEQVGTNLMVYLPHLAQKVNHPGDILFCGKTNGHNHVSFIGCRKNVVWRTGAGALLALPLGELAAPYGAD